jgi:TonB family protein
MVFTWSKKLLVAAAAALFAVSLAFAQQTIVEEGKRKIKTKVTPAIPELARRMNITGKVKVEVVIAPDGRVKSSRAIGGHPVLVQSCLDAIKEWKFEPAPEESTQMVEFDFKQ